MAIWPLLILAALASGAIFMHILSCVLYNNWWPMLLVLGYLLLPIPVGIVLRSRANDGLFESGSRTAERWAEFFGAFILAFIVGIPCILLRAGIVETGAVLMDLAGFLLVIATAVFGLFSSYQPEDGVSMFG